MHLQRFSLLLLLTVIIFITLTSWVVDIIKGNVPFVDQWTRGFVESVADSHLYTIARLITELGSASFLVPFTVGMGLVLWWIFRDWLPSVIFAGGTLISHLLNVFIKNSVARQRPRIFIEANAEGYSFPSGHAMLSMVCYGLVMYFLIKKVKSKKSIMVIQAGFSLLILIIGLSRYVINVHYLTDVITGFVIGYLFLLTLIYVFEFIQTRRA